MTTLTDKFLITTSYRGQNQSVIWRLDLEKDSLVSKRELRLHDNSFLPITYDHAAWGISRANGNFYVSEANGISVIDEATFQTVNHLQDTNKLRCCHDIRVIGEEIFLANTLCDKVEIFSTDLVHKKTINLKSLPGLNKIKTLSKNHISAISDCFHINFFSLFEGQIYFTLSFIGKKERCFTRRPPFIAHFRKPAPGCIYNYSAKKVFVNNLRGAHDGDWVDEKLWVNKTYDMSLESYSPEGSKLSEFLYKDAAIYRGIAITDKYMVVGATKVDESRAGAKEAYSTMAKERGGIVPTNSSIHVYTRRMELVRKYSLPNHKGIRPEVYKVVPLMGL